MPRGVRLGRGKTRRRAEDTDRRGALKAELGRSRQLCPAVRAPKGQRRRALHAELRLGVGSRSGIGDTSCAPPTRRARLRSGDDSAGVAARSNHGAGRAVLAAVFRLVPPPPSPANTSCPSRGTSSSRWRDARGPARACPCDGRACRGRGGSGRAGPDPHGDAPASLDVDVTDGEPPAFLSEQSHRRLAVPREAARNRGHLAAEPPHSSVSSSKRMCAAALLSFERSPARVSRYRGSVDRGRVSPRTNRRSTSQNSPVAVTAGMCARPTNS